MGLTAAAPRTQAAYTALKPSCLAFSAAEANLSADGPGSAPQLSLADVVFPTLTRNGDGYAPVRLHNRKPALHSRPVGPAGASCPWPGV